MRPALAASANTSSLDRRNSGTSPWEYPERERRRTAAVANITAAGKTILSIHDSLAAGTETSDPTTTAMDRRAARSIRRAMAVVVAASAMGTPDRAANNGLTISPNLNGNTWLASSAACIAESSGKTPALWLSNCFQATVLSQKAAVYAVSRSATSSGRAPREVTAGPKLRPICQQNNGDCRSHGEGQSKRNSRHRRPSGVTATCRRRQRL